MRLVVVVEDVIARMVGVVNLESGGERTVQHL